MHDVNCVVTLTYDDGHLPADGSLDRAAFPKFARRLRKAGRKVRYFQCGEYGDDFARPHYHAALFGLDFEDKVECEPSKSGAVQWVSPELEHFWPYGISKIGSLNFESAAYIARYVTKKITGQKALEHYSRVDPYTGEIYQVEPEFATMSRRPGIGAGWFEQYSAEVYPHDEVIVRGRACKPPRYYDGKLPEDELSAVKSRRFASSVGRLRNGSQKRLQVREKCAEARLNLYPRG